MKEEITDQDEPEMLEEYDFSNGIRGKYAEAYAAGANIVLLEPDVAQVFQDAASVNSALRALIKIAQQAPVRHSGS